LSDAAFQRFQREARSDAAFEAVNVQRMTVSTRVGSLRVIEVWKSLLEHRACVCAWSVHMSGPGGRESLSVDLFDCSPEQLATINASLEGRQMTVLMTELQPTNSVRVTAVQSLTR
jgi:hypothetical protein